MAVDKPIKFHPMNCGRKNGNQLQMTYDAVHVN